MPILLLPSSGGGGGIYPDEARSGIMHSGYTRSANYTRSFAIRIGATDRTTRFKKPDFAITYNLGAEPDTLTAKVRGFIPIEGQRVLVYDGGIGVGVPLFVGTILRCPQETKKRNGATYFNIEAVDDTWRLDAYSTVTGIYRNVARNTLLARLISQHTDPADGLRLGYCDGRLGSIDKMEFTFTPLSEVVERVTRQIDGAYWKLDHYGRVSVFTDDYSDFSANTHVIDDTSTSWRNFAYDPDLSQVRTRVVVQGRGGVTTQGAAAGSTTLGVSDLGWYKAAGGEVIAENQRIAYTGRSAASGSGQLTGVSGITDDLASDVPVNVLHQVDDVAAQANLASILGGGRSGVVVHYIQDETLDAEGAQERGEADLAMYSGVISGISYNNAEDRYVYPGKLVQVSTTSPGAGGPVAVNGSFRVQSVTITPRGRVMGSDIGLDRRIEAAVVRQQLIDLIKRLAR